MIKSKNPWNDRPENASQSKVTRWCHGPSLGSGPSHTTTQQPGWGRATAERGVLVLERKGPSRGLPGPFQLPGGQYKPGANVTLKVTSRFRLGRRWMPTRRPDSPGRSPRRPWILSA